MDHIERRDKEMAYISDESVMKEQQATRKILQELNFCDRADFKKIQEISYRLLGKAGKNLFINPPFYCDYGTNIEVGDPVHPAARNTMYEYGISIAIGDNVWVGGNSVILPGVHIGSNTVIGAGSVVTKDIPDGVIAAGNPCRVIRKITEDDRQYYFRSQKFDDEAWEVVKNAPYEPKL